MTPALRTEDYVKYLSPEVISRVSSLELRARLVVEGFLVGLHRSPYHGFSVEFSQRRPYMQGDPLKNVDWKAYGKTDRYFVKQYEEETNLRAYFFLDLSRSMAFGSKGMPTKLDYGKSLLASLAYLSLKQRDAVGLTLFSDRTISVAPPKAAPSHLKTILAELANAESEGKTDAATALDEVAESSNRRGLVVVVSDFFDDLDRALGSLKRFRFKGHETVVFRILDPAETRFDFRRDATFLDMETGEKLATHPGQIRRAYLDAMREHLEEFKRGCLDNGVEYNLIETDAPFDRALYAYLQKRARMR
jgi:uncharacterized protein (DUF58 family)